MMFSTLILGDGPLVIPCAETLLRHKHTIQAIVSTNDVIQEWAQEQKIPWVARQDDLLSAVDGRPVDYLFSIANLSLVPARILALPASGRHQFSRRPVAEVRRAPRDHVGHPQSGDVPWRHLARDERDRGCGRHPEAVGLPSRPR